MQAAVGQEVIATMGAGSFFKQVRGTVTAIRNGRVQINATRVMSKWSDQWADHPTSCACAAAIADVRAV